MNTNHTDTNRIQPDGGQYALRRDGGRWQLTFAGRQSAFKHELGALYVAYLLSERPRQPIHGVALALKAREKLGQPPSPAEALQQRAWATGNPAGVWPPSRSRLELFAGRSWSS